MNQADTAAILASTASGRRPAGASEPVWRAARGFFVLALASVLVAAPILHRFDHSWTLLVWSAWILALYGLALSVVAEGAARRRPADRPRAALSPEGWCTFAVFTAFLAFYGVTSYPETMFNEPVLQAVAFLHRHTYIDAPIYIECAKIGPYQYSLHPPMAAIALMPLAAWWGLQTPETAFTVVLGALNAALVWYLLGRFRLSINAKVWLTLFFCVGTDLWFDVIVGNTWALPMVLSVTFTLAALIEVFGQARTFRLGVFAALATLARYDLALAAPALALIALWRGRSIRQLLWMAPGFIAVGIFFVGFNEARFHSFFDMGVILTAPKGHPAFSLIYLPGNLYTIFFIGPGVDGRFPYIHPTFTGQAIPLTSPAFALAFRARWRRFATHMMWAAAFMGSIPSLLCYANGFAQFGTRHYIQVYPYLLVLMALGMPRRTDQFTKVLIGVSIFLITFGVWHIRMYGYG